MKKLILQYHFWVLGILGSFLASCNTKYRVWVGDDNEQKIFNLKYGENKKQKMDIFLPSQYEENLFVILVHGGGWKYGKKENMIKIQKFLFENKIPSANINYRLIKKNINYKDQLQDIASSIEKLNQLTQKSKWKPDHYIILGESAGAHLALLYGYRNPDQILKIISMSGPTDFFSDTFLNSTYSKYSSPTISKAVGVKFDRKNLSNAFREASPIEQVTNVPTLIFQGDSDFLVNKSQGLKLDSVLSEKNIPHRLILMKNSGHVPRFWSKKKRDELIFPAILDWIQH